MDGSQWENLLRWKIWGYPYFWKHPYEWIPSFFDVFGHCHPRKNDSRLSFSALRELLYDPHTRRMRPQRLATMLQVLPRDDLSHQNGGS